ncbi:hypothetical protein ACFUJR_25545 [Streptomyces sp. NPDC057271]|uniref:hypothetical protein n=1 Tax=unclassified Streptomyces TaxID=2593676 RepID=UPI003638E038
MLVAAPERTVAQAARALHQEYVRFDECSMGRLVARNDGARLRELATERADRLHDLSDGFLHLVDHHAEPPR